MAYTAIPSVSTGETWTASNQNTYVKDNVSYLYSQVGAQFWLSAGGSILSTTNGAPLTPEELTTNKINIITRDFDKDTIEYTEWLFTLPSDYDGSTFTSRFYWKHPVATAYNVIWGLQGRAYTNGDALDQALGTAQEVTDIGGTTDDLYLSDATSAITVAGSPAGGQLVTFRAYRKASDGSDTLNVDAQLVGILVNYTRT